jgi:hypothetical protein
MGLVMLSAAFVCFELGAFTSPAGAQTFPYEPHPCEVNAPDPAAAANWCEKYFGGRRITEGPDRLMFGSTRFLFLKKADAKPSSGSALDHAAFSFAKPSRGKVTIRELSIGRNRTSRQSSC